MHEENEDKLIALLFSMLPNLQTLWMVMPEVHYETEYEDNVLSQFLEKTDYLATSGTLQKLETLYICSPMRKFLLPLSELGPPTYIESLDLGSKDHREYELDLRAIFPFMRLPNMRSLYTLTTHMWWERDTSPVDYAALKQTSNITTLSYDESALYSYDVIESLSIFKSLKSFRWTAPSYFWINVDRHFTTFQNLLGTALAAHKETLEEFYFDSRQQDDRRGDKPPVEKDAILLGSLKEFKKLRSLALNVTSLCGHQKFVPSPTPLVELLPPNLETLTLFVKVVYIERAEGVWEMLFDDQLWYLNFLDMVRNAPTKLRRLRSIGIKLTRDRPTWEQRQRGLVEFEVNPFAFKEATEVCADVGIPFDIRVAVEVDVDSIREEGYTTIPYFLEQIKVRNPGRDF